MPNIDIHFHAIPPGFVDPARGGAFRDAVEIGEGGRLLFHAPDDAGVEPGLVLRPPVHDVGLILEAIGRLGLDMAAVSCPPEFFMYWAPAEVGVPIARAVNDGYAAWAAAWPDRLAPLATLPMQDPPAAARELHRAVGGLGLRGVAICTHVNGTDLDDARFEPVWAAAAALNAPVFLHPQNSGDMRRLADFHLWNMVGFPAETATAAARLIMAGLFARHPALKLVLAHGGGFLPYQLGRLDHGWRARAALRRHCPEPPTTYLRNIWCDSLVHDPQALAFLVARLGADHVVLGTDHPFDMGDPQPLASLARAGLPAETMRKIAGDTLAALLRLN